MNQESFVGLIKELQTLPKETEWVGFKESNYKPQEIGEYISALSNSACLHDKERAYLVFGIQNKDHRVVGTSFKPTKEKIGNQELENWLATQLDPRMDFVITEREIDDKQVVLISIDPTLHTPVKFRGEAFIRVGSYKKKLVDFPEKARKIWTKTRTLEFEKGNAMNGLNADEVLKFIDYPAFFTVLSLPLPSDKKGILMKMEEEKVLEKKSNKYSITILGAILFAKDLTSFDKLARKVPRVIKYIGHNRLKTEKEQEGRKGYATGLKD